MFSVFSFKEKKNKILVTKIRQRRWHHLQLSRPAWSLDSLLVHQLQILVNDRQHVLSEMLAVDGHSAYQRNQQVAVAHLLHHDARASDFFHLVEPRNDWAARRVFQKTFADENNVNEAQRLDISQGQSDLSR